MLWSLRGLPDLDAIEANRALARDANDDVQAALDDALGLIEEEQKCELDETEIEV